MLGGVARLALLIALGTLMTLSGLVRVEPSSAGCSPNFHWTDFGPVWSPTGDKIAYQRIEIGCFGPRQTYVIDADGGAPRGMRFGERPSWSPDGRRLAFSGNLTIVNVDGSASEELRRYPSRHPTWSPDGRFIAFGGGSEHQDVYRIGSDGFGETNLTNTPGQNESNPSWSPRGDLIAFAFGQASNLAVMGPDGSGRRTVYTGRPPESETVWSPDGTSLAFLTRSGLYSMELVVVDVATASSRVLAGGSLVYGDPSWSPDSGRISFNRHIAGTPPIHTMRTIRIDGTDEQNLGPGADLAWSPDGSRIAFVAFGDHCPTRQGLYVAAPDRAGERRLTNECRLTGTPRADFLRGSVDDDVVDALAGNDRIEALFGTDRVEAGEGNDVVLGGQAPDLIIGGPGNDRLEGDMGADVLVGGPGRDRLSGGHGIDRISARDGAVDRITCGSHRDLVIADRRDRVARDCERVRRA
jgi:RTX calcium-binding nonapeptide repeat (4 copies)/WD40-like Beta Propeller Repeat